MKKVWRIILLALVVLLIGIQFIRPEKNDSLINPEQDLTARLRVSPEVKQKLRDACYDCHSNRTDYPFYSQIAPVSWMMARHIREGKAHLNFSEWGTMDRKQQLKYLTEICEVITGGEMPLRSYLLMHRDAAFDQAQTDMICQWTEQAGEEILGDKY